MGLCRGFNLMLGVAVSPAALERHWPLAAIPVTYVAAVTLLSRGEVLGGTRSTGRVALTLVLGVVAALTVLSLQARGSLIAGLGLTALLAWRVVPPFLRAVRSPSVTTIRQAVGIGVLSLVLVDGVIAAVNAGMIYCLVLLATALLAGRLARAFAVT
jgi:4-hydroxybenzoate polyprenyltransferase